MTSPTLWLLAWTLGSSLLVLPAHAAAVKPEPELTPEELAKCHGLKEAATARKLSDDEKKEYEKCLADLYDRVPSSVHQWRDEQPRFEWKM